MSSTEALPPIKLPPDIADQPWEALPVNIRRGILVARTLVECMPEGRTVTELAPNVCHDILAEFTQHNNPTPTRLANRTQSLGELVTRPIKAGIVDKLLEHNDYWLQQGIVTPRRAQHGRPPRVFRAWPLAALFLVGPEEFTGNTELRRTVLWRRRTASYV